MQFAQLTESQSSHQSKAASLSLLRMRGMDIWSIDHPSIPLLEGWQQFFINSTSDTRFFLSLIQNCYWSSPASLPIARFFPAAIMLSTRFLLTTLFASSIIVAPTFAQTTGTVTSSTIAPSGTFASTSASGNTTRTSSSALPTGTAPDVHLRVPNLSVGKIELDVDNLRADINLNAQVAGLVKVNAGVKVGIEKVNITIADVSAELELTVRLGHLVDIVNRVFDSLDLNPLLISVVNATTEILGDVVGAVDGLLGSITQGGSVLNFLVDNLGNIVQQVTDTAGSTVSSIVGSFSQNMTLTGATKNLGNGLTQKTYSYSPLNALVDIVFNTLGQVVQATVQGKNSGSGGSSTSASATGTATATSAASTTVAPSASATTTPAAARRRLA